MGFGWCQVSQAFAGLISRHNLESQMFHLGFFAAQGLVLARLFIGRFE
jgi:hypothetical protein